MKSVVNSVVFDPELRHQFRLLCCMGVQIFLRLVLDTQPFLFYGGTVEFIYVFSRMIF